MRRALELAKLASSAGEVPIGALIVRDNQIISESHNLVESVSDPTGHAEILAIRQACKALANWRLADCSLFVTLEPCPMCIGAILLARIPEVYFGCPDPRQGACGSAFDLSQNCGLPSSTAVFPQVLENECRMVLESFFQERRK